MSAGGTGDGTIGGVAEPAIVDWLVARHLLPSTVATYEGELRRIDRWCRQQDVALADIPVDELERYVATVPQTRSSLSTLRSALRYFWSIAGRPDPPSVEVPVLVGRAGRDPLRGIRRGRAPAATA